MMKCKLPAAQVIEGVSEEMREQFQAAASKIINITCPICKEQGITTIFTISLPIFFIKEHAGGVTTIHVHPSCGHRFAVFIDTNFKIRGIEIPALVVTEVPDEPKTEPTRPRTRKKATRKKLQPQQIASLAYKIIMKQEPAAMISSIDVQDDAIKIFLVKQLVHEGDIAQTLASKLNQRYIFHFMVKA